MDRKSVFTEIYNTGYWRVARDQWNKSASGAGSTIWGAHNILRELPILFSELSINSVADIGCGDWAWTQHLNLDAIKYVGYDLVEDLINENSKKYSKENISFKVADIVDQPVEFSDLALVRSVFIHLPNEDIFKALKNLKLSGIKYLLISNYTWRGIIPSNSDIAPGEWRAINFQKNPFNFPPPLLYIPEGNMESEHSLGDSLALWEMSNLPV